MKILGISAYYHDSSAALIENGHILAACQEESFSRIKHDAQFPKQAISECLKIANCHPDEVSAIVFYEKPFLKFERIVETFLNFSPRGFSMFRRFIPTWINEKLFQKKLLTDELSLLGFNTSSCPILFSEHHLSHAASAFFSSSFDEALVLTLDGVGEWETTTLYYGSGNQLKKLAAMHFPHSLGLLYSAFTYHCGFKVNSGEYKLMGLAPYGNPIFTEIILNTLLDLKEDGSFCLNMEYFDYCVGDRMTHKKFNDLFQKSQRNNDEPILQIHMDLAASIQNVIEIIILKICRHFQKQYSISNLCLAGGVALNCVANGKIRKAKIFDNIWIQPAAGDAGGALGAALAGYYLHFKKQRIKVKPDLMQGAFLGSRYTNAEIEEALIKASIKFKNLESDETLDFVATQIAQQKVIGWFHGPMEYGPRALGHRSILADPRSHDMQKNLNLKIKFRESFRPFAPAILEEEVSNWFDFDDKSPYMLMVAQINENKKIPIPTPQQNFVGFDRLRIIRSQVSAITHVDGSARLQTVNAQINPRFHQLISKFYEKTNCPILINTSFNIRGEPIVCSPEDAIRCFLGTDLDFLIIENFVVDKTEQSHHILKNYQNQFELD